MQLAVRFGPRLGLCDLPLAPAVLDRLPLGSVTVHREGNDDLGGSGDVFELCFPEAVSRKGLPPRAFLARAALNPRSVAERLTRRLFAPRLGGVSFQVPMFCFPRGVRLKRSSKFSQPPPAAFSYLFTEEMGRRVYVSCLVFYEEVPTAKVGGGAAGLSNPYRLSLLPNITALPYRLT